MKIRRSLLKDTVTVRSYAGETAYGPGYSASTDVACNVDMRRRLVRTSSGEETVASVTLHAHPDAADLFTLESRVQVLGNDVQVLDARTHTLRGKPTHVEVLCG